MQTVADLTERELIARIRQHLPASPEWLLVGIGDDAAVVEPERNRVDVLTTDMLIEGVHFDRRITPPDAIGRRALAANLSDLASMGAAPRFALLSLALPETLLCRDFDAMIAGLAALASAHRLHVIGGNLTRSPGPLVVDLTLSGTVKRRQALLRSGARPGDVLYVSGSVGGAAAGLGALLDPPEGGVEDQMAACVQRFLYPEARVRLGLLLSRNRAATACMDLSDGLADAVTQLTEASGVGAVLEADLLPIDAAALDWFASRGRDPVIAAIAGGDDYELLFAVRPRLRGRLRAVARHGNVTLTRIGVCTDGGGAVLRRTVDGAPVDEPLPRGYAHFR